ncbi:hypothetical protein Trydic_g15953 [Trypoxylus dichotomus]
MNFMVCTVFVIGSLVSGHTIRYKREILQGSAYDNQIQQTQGSIDEGQISHVTLTKEIPIHQPVLVPVPVERKIPRPIYVDVPVPIDQPYYVKVHRPYPVPIYKDIPYTVYKDVPIPVKVAIEVPYPVKVPVLVPHPVPIPIDIPVKVPYPDVKVVKKPIVLEHQELVNGGDDVGGNDGSDIGLNAGSAAINHSTDHEDLTVAQSVERNNNLKADENAGSTEADIDKQN